MCFLVYCGYHDNVGKVEVFVTVLCTHGENIIIRELDMVNNRIVPSVHVAQMNNPIYSAPGLCINFTVSIYMGNIENAWNASNRSIKILSTLLHVSGVIILLLACTVHAHRTCGYMRQKILEAKAHEMLSECNNGVFSGLRTKFNSLIIICQITIHRYRGDKFVLQNVCLNVI